MTESQFEQLFKDNFQMLANVANAVVKDHDQAKDIVQQVFVKFWGKRDTVNLEDNILAYLKRAVVNTAINHLEKVKKLKLEENFATHQIMDENSGAIREKNIETINIELKKAIEALPEKCQVVFSLSRYEGMTNQEVADYLKISVKAVEKHISRALRELREKLQPIMHLISIILLYKVGLVVFSLLVV